MNPYDCAISCDLRNLRKYYERLDKFIEQEKMKKEKVYQNPHWTEEEKAIILKENEK